MKGNKIIVFQNYTDSPLPAIPLPAKAGHVSGTRLI